MIAVIGAGGWGSNHIRELAAMGVLHSVVDSDVTKLAEVTNQHPSVLTTTELSEILNANIHGVVVATPPNTHFALAKVLIEAKKDVLVEKPLAMTHSEALELVDLARQNDIVLASGHLLEYHPMIQELISRVRGGAIGGLHYLSSNRLNFGKFRQHENVFQSFAPHDIGLILRLSQSLPSKIEYVEKATRNDKPADIALTNLWFESGLQAHVFVSWLNPFKEHRFVAVGETGFLTIDGVAGVLRQYKGSNGHAAKTTSARAELVDELTFPHANPLKAELQDFVTCIKSREEPLSSSQLGADVVGIIDRALANRRGK
jgi:UDP-2-acetamido-3-amino-2,3-dideoxy-glucuronate N-acetyltransferase